MLHPSGIYCFHSFSRGLAAMVPGGCRVVFVEIVWKLFGADWIPYVSWIFTTGAVQIFLKSVFSTIANLTCSEEKLLCRVLSLSLFHFLLQIHLVHTAKFMLRGSNVHMICNASVSWKECGVQYIWLSGGVCKHIIDDKIFQQVSHCLNVGYTWGKIEKFSLPYILNMPS